jgi:outer membrane protein assembly factor BamE (lipoprotein component of BamABCDE complex)
MRGTILTTSILLLATGVVLAGCSRQLVGQPIREDLIPKIAVGKTTRAEVLTLFGSPYRIETHGETETLTYLYGTESVWTVGVYTEIQRSADILTISLDRNRVVSAIGFSKGVSTPDFYRPRVPGAPY